MRLAALICLIAALALPARGQETDDAAIRAVIADQLQAFDERDVPRAWGHASETIQRLFGTPGNFALMVENGYPMVWTNDGATFLDRFAREGREWQRIALVDAQGVRHVLDYAMIETPQGWRIDAVVIVPAPDVGV